MATIEDRTALINTLKKGNAALTALQAAMNTAIGSLDPATATDADVQVAVDAWNTAISNYRDHAEIRLPALSTLFNDAVSDVSAGAV